MTTDPDITRVPRPARPIYPAMWAGWTQCCPNCRSGRMYASYLKVAAACASCGEEFHHQRADDAPPYFTMLIVGHVVIAGLVMVERKFAPEIWVQLAIWLPMTLALSLWLLPRIKGALIGLQWALRMHGFDTSPDPAVPDPGLGHGHGMTSPPQHAPVTP